MVSELVPVLVSVTDCAAAVVPTTVLPKARLEGVTETPGAVPTPLRAMVCVPPLALSLMVITPVCVPLATGVKAAAMTQVPPADTGAEVEHVVLGSKAKLPLIVRALISSGLLPVFVRVTVCAAAAVPATVLPKVRVDGLRDTPANVPVPARLTLLVPTFDRDGKGSGAAACRCRSKCHSEIATGAGRERVRSGTSRRPRIYSEVPTDAERRKAHGRSPGIGDCHALGPAGGSHGLTAENETSGVERNDRG